MHGGGGWWVMGGGARSPFGSPATALSATGGKSKRLGHEASPRGASHWRQRQQRGASHGRRQQRRRRRATATSSCGNNFTASQWRRRRGRERCRVRGKDRDGETTGGAGGGRPHRGPAGRGGVLPAASRGLRGGSCDMGRRARRLLRGSCRAGDAAGPGPGCGGVVHDRGGNG